jgi:hypothetical protein
MDLAKQRMKQAITRIDEFVKGITDGTLSITPERFRELSCCIQLAKLARQEAPLQSPDPRLADLTARYRLSLARLQRHLEQIEISLSSERARLLAEHSRLARAREWKEQFNRTQ